MTGDRTVNVAIIQQPAAMLDLEESFRRANRYLNEAANAGAQLVVFPEAWLTCYPAWVFGRAGWGDPIARRWYGRLLEHSPVIGAPDELDDGLAPLRRAAREHDITLVMGLNERSGPNSGTLYNSLVTIGPDGRILNLHRKLTPTHTERIIWDRGDGAGLRGVDTPAGRVGGLVCWEHWYPLARQAMHISGEQIHVAAWPDLPEMHQLAARSYAYEGRCFVLSAGQYVSTDDVPEELLDAYRAGVGPDAPESGILFGGGSAVAGPDGNWLVEPLVGEPGIVTATLDLSALPAEKYELDVSGHYSRTDVFDLTVDRRRKSAATFLDDK